jgi:hypothetical protein
VKRLLTIPIAAALAATALAGTAAAQPSALSCSGQSLVQPFLPWLDPAHYVLLPNGALESSSGWKLRNGAKLTAGNEPFHVNTAKDATSLTLPAGSSAISPPMCVTLLHPDLRFFAVNTGSLLSPLEVDVITTIGGLQVTTPAGLVVAGGTWQPTLPLPFLSNLLAPVTGSVSFRFTPLRGGGRWQVDDVYLDPYKSS